MPERSRQLIAGASLAALLLVAVADAALPGTRVRGDTATGRPAIGSVLADVTNPRAIYGRAVGSVDNATFVITCSRGFRVAGTTFSRNGPGLWRLPIPIRSADFCRITASAGGDSGKVLLEIRAVRRSAV